MHNLSAVAISGVFEDTRQSEFKLRLSSVSSAGPAGEPTNMLQIDFGLNHQTL